MKLKFRMGERGSVIQTDSGLSINGLNNLYITPNVPSNATRGSMLLELLTET